MLTPMNAVLAGKKVSTASPSVRAHGIPFDQDCANVARVNKRPIVTDAFAGNSVPSRSASMLPRST